VKKIILTFALVISASVAAYAQGSMAMAPARFELEMQPGTETTVVIGVDFKADAAEKPVRIVASLNDWTMKKEGQIEFFPANTQANSASPWLIYSPGEATVMPGILHQIRVTVSVPANATPGDHLAALVIEQRPDTIKLATNARQVVVRYRLATVFYIKVGGLTRKGNFENLFAEASPDGIIVTPTFKNEGNSVIRPLTSVSVVDGEGKEVAAVAQGENLPVLAGSQLAQPRLIEQTLAAGKYKVKYRVDFQDGRAATEGVTDLVVSPQIARGADQKKKPE
jgi:hypothetical protein